MVTLFTRRVRSRVCAARRHPKRMHKCGTNQEKEEMSQCSLSSLSSLNIGHCTPSGWRPLCTLNKFESINDGIFLYNKVCRVCGKKRRKCSHRRREGRDVSVFSVFSVFSQCRTLTPLRGGHLFTPRNILRAYMVTLFTRRVRSRGCAARRHPKRRHKCATQHNTPLIPNSSLIYKTSLIPEITTTIPSFFLNRVAPLHHNGTPASRLHHVPCIRIASYKQTVFSLFSQCRTLHPIRGGDLFTP